MSGSWDGGKRVAGAAALAAERVNADEALLPGQRLEYSWADSGCSAQHGLAAMGELLAGESKIDAVIGPGCSSACEVTSYLSAGQKIPQISWGCIASALSNKKKFGLVRLAALYLRLSINVSNCWNVVAVLAHSGTFAKQRPRAHSLDAALPMEQDRQTFFN